MIIDYNTSKLVIILSMQFVQFPDANTMHWSVECMRSIPLLIMHCFYLCSGYRDAQ